MTAQNSPVSPVTWLENRVLLIDQNRLPKEYGVVEISCCDDMAEVIKTMIVRGAPAIGVAAAYGMYLGAREIETGDRTEFLTKLEKVGDLLRSTCPTAVNLFWAISRMLKTADRTSGSVEQIQKTLLEIAKTIQAEDLQTCKDIGDKGLEVLPATPEKLTFRIAARLFRISLKNSRVYSYHTREIEVTFTQQKCSRRHSKKQNFSVSACCLGITILNLPVFAASTVGEVQLSQVIKAKEAEGKQYVASMNRAQQAYYAENTGFTSSVANLGLGIKAETANYKYSIGTGNKAVFNYGVSQQADLKSFVGGVFLIGNTTKTILCQTNAASKTKPANPTNKNGVLTCGANTVQIPR